MLQAIHNPDWRLRPGHTAPIPVAEPIDWHPWIPLVGGLGRAKKLVTPRLKLADYIDRAVATPPPSAVVRPHPTLVWQMLLNDQLGDCVPAGIIHTIMSAHADAGTPIPNLTNATVQPWYGLIGGYVPGNPSTDQGCDENVAVQKWEEGLHDEHGHVHRILGTVAVNPQDLLECRTAIWEFDGLFTGQALPQTAQGQSEWVVVGNPDTDPAAQPASWGGHCVPYREYDADTFKCVTWGQELLLTTGFHNTYCDEAHVVITREQIGNTKVGPSGVQWGDMLSDLRKLKPAQAEKVEQEEKPKPKARRKKVAELASEQGSGDIQEQEDSQEEKKSKGSGK